MVLSIRLPDDLDSRLSVVAEMRKCSKSEFARDAIQRSVEAAEGDGPRKFSYQERLSMMLQANWAAYPEGHSERVPPKLILEMTSEGHEALIPTLLEQHGPAVMSGLALSVSHLKMSALDDRLLEISEMMHRIRYLQYYNEAPVFTGIAQDIEAHRFARYYWLIQLNSDDSHEDYDDIFPGLKVDFTLPSKPLEYWYDLAIELTSDDQISKSAGWERRGKL